VTNTHRCVMSLRTQPPLLLFALFRMWSRDDVLCCVLEHVYGAVAWQWVFTLHYYYYYYYTNCLFFVFFPLSLLLLFFVIGLWAAKFERKQLELNRIITAIVTIERFEPAN
jgi:hypothetical protein